jgi:cation:H+ antiporter
MAFDVVLLMLGMTLLVAGGHALVEGASQLADSLGVSEVAIGLTVVAFGTSAPELAVNTLAAISGNAPIAFGNIIGSNIANIGLVLGLSALVRPLLIESEIVSREIPMLLLASAAALILGLDRLRGADELYDRADGLIFLLLFSVFLYYSISEVVAKRRKDPLAESAAENVHARAFWTRGRALLLAAAGLAILFGGAQLTVANAVSLAEALDVPGVIIGLTIVALGTSLPELATSLVATWRGQTSLAVGTVVGSNIFNLLFILGATAVIEPVEVSEVRGGADLVAMAMFAALLLPLSRSDGSHIVRWHGVALVAAYLGYMAWRLQLTSAIGW